MQTGSPSTGAERRENQNHLRTEAKPSVPSLQGPQQRAESPRHGPGSFRAQLQGPGCVPDIPETSTHLFPHQFKSPSQQGRGDVPSEQCKGVCLKGPRPGSVEGPRGQRQPAGRRARPSGRGEKPVERLCKGATRALEGGWQWGTASLRTPHTPTRCPCTHLLGAEWPGKQEAESPAAESVSGRGGRGRGQTRVLTRRGAGLGRPSRRAGGPRGGWSPDPDGQTRQHAGWGVNRAGPASQELGSGSWGHGGNFIE